MIKMLEDLGGVYMKVLVVIKDLNIRGGTHKQVLRLCDYLDKNNEVIIFTRIYEKEKTYSGFEKFNIITPKINNNIKDNIISKIINRIKNNIIEDKALKKLLDDVDIVNIHDCGVVRLVKVAKKKNKKVVLQINDVPNCFLEGHEKGQSDSLKKKLQRIMFRNLIMKVDKITVNVTKNKEIVKRCFNRDAEVFYCGVDVNENLKRHYGIQNEKRLNIFSSGVFFPYRNYETLVNVIEKIVKSGMDVHLDIMGSTDRDKDYSNYIKKMISDKQLNDYITIWGQVDDEKYVELHDNADIFIFININQSWGLAVFEAMSCGLPVIVSDSVGAIEILNDRENAIILDPKNIEEIINEIIKLKEDKDYYKKISNNAYEITKSFTWDNLYNSKMLELFEDIVKE